MPQRRPANHLRATALRMQSLDGPPARRVRADELDDPHGIAHGLVRPPREGVVSPPPTRQHHIEQKLMEALMPAI
jgi:hypothetical protein